MNNFDDSSKFWEVRMASGETQRCRVGEEGVT